MDDYGHCFVPKITTLEIKNCHSFELLGSFTLDLGEFANTLVLNTNSAGNRRYTLMMDKLLEARPLPEHVDGGSPRVNVSNGLNTLDIHIMLN